MKKNLEKLNRREFLGLSALGLASFTILPSWSVNGQKFAPSDRVVMGFIGLGRQGLSDFYAASKCPGVQGVAGCDVDSLKTARFAKKVMEWQKEAGWNQRCDSYEFYEDLLDRKDIDVVSIATPDHWHALAAIHACQASKDVYLQKPLTYTISESLAVKRAVRANNRVLQVGSQQRSDSEFQKAIYIVRSGMIGHIESVQVQIGEPPVPFDLPEFPVPASLNFNRWMGPLTSPKVHYHPDMCPPIDNPEMKETGPWAVWRYYQETGNGFTGDWGAHHYDITQAALGMDGSGPSEYIPKGYNGTKHCTMKYANGIVVTEQIIDDWKDGKPDPNEKGIKFFGTKGWLKVARGFIECSDPSVLKEIGEDRFKKPSHMQNFVDCVRSREIPIAPVEVGCSTNIMCCLNNIAHELRRPVNWDPATLSFGNDKEAEAHRLYHYDYRNPYKLPYWDE